MDSSGTRFDLQALLPSAVRGEPAAHEELLRMYRPYLRLMAGRRLPRILQQRMDASDIVQETLVDAVRGLPDFRGTTEPEFTAWILRLLERKLLMSVRNNILGKRDVRLEQNWTDESGSAVVAWQSVSDGTSPVSRVFKGEAALQLAMALDRLPADQRVAVELRYLEQRPLQEIANEMERTVGSVAGLIRRGVDALEAFLPAEFGDLT